MVVPEAACVRPGIPHPELHPVLPVRSPPSESTGDKIAVNIHRLMWRLHLVQTILVADWLAVLVPPNLGEGSATGATSDRQERGVTNGNHLLPWQHAWCSKPFRLFWKTQGDQHINIIDKLIYIVILEPRRDTEKRGIKQLFHSLKKRAQSWLMKVCQNVNSKHLVSVRDGSPRPWELSRPGLTRILGSLYVVSSRTTCGLISKKELDLVDYWVTQGAINRAVITISHRGRYQQSCWFLPYTPEGTTVSHSTKFRVHAYLCPKYELERNTRVKVKGGVSYQQLEGDVCHMTHWNPTTFDIMIITWLQNLTGQPGA